MGDFDGDGWLDIVRTNFSEQVTTLYPNYGGSFEDASLRGGLGVNRKYVGFGVDFFDFDHAVEVAWPYGLKETFRDLPADHLIVIQETKGILDRRRFG